MTDLTYERTAMPGFELDFAVAALASMAAARALERVANRVDAGTPTAPVDLRAPRVALEAAPPSGGTTDAAFDGELALCAAVVERVEALWRVAEGP